MKDDLKKHQQIKNLLDLILKKNKELELSLKFMQKNLEIH